MTMPKTKNGGFKLDDSSLAPYGSKKTQDKPKNSPKKTEKGKKK